MGSAKRRGLHWDQNARTEEGEGARTSQTFLFKRDKCVQVNVKTSFTFFKELHIVSHNFMKGLFDACWTLVRVSWVISKVMQ